MSIPQVSFWNSNTDLQPQAEILHSLVPGEGEVVDKHKNRKLEKFRKACNVYYDLFNNGLYNRASELRPIFGLNVTDYRERVYDRRNGRCHTEIKDQLYTDIEPIMRQIVIDACKEQNIVI